MAIISHSQNFIFVHVPKTGGTSVSNYLSSYTSYCDLELGGTEFGESLQKAYRKRFRLYKHVPASGIKAVIDSGFWEKSFKFGIVRNPYQRAISTYHFLRNWSGTPDRIRNKLDKVENFEQFVHSGIWDELDGPDKMFKAQSFWLCEEEHSKELLVNYVGKLEHLQPHMDFVTESIGLPPNPKSTLKALNRSSRKRGPLELSDKTKELIAEKYRSDFETFDYPL